MDPALPVTELFERLQLRVKNAGNKLLVIFRKGIFFQLAQKVLKFEYNPG